MCVRLAGVRSDCLEVLRRESNEPKVCLCESGAEQLREDSSPSNERNLLELSQFLEQLDICDCANPALQLIPKHQEVFLLFNLPCLHVVIGNSE